MEEREMVCAIYFLDLCTSGSHDDTAFLLTLQWHHSTYTGAWFGGLCDSEDSQDQQGRTDV